MTGNKKIYSLDEYYKDKYGGQTAMTPLDRAGSRSPGVSAVYAGTTQRRKQFLRSMNVTEKSQQTTEQTQTTPDTAGGIDTTSLDNLSPEGGALTEKEFNSKLTTANTMSMLEDALSSLAEWGNRKFVYNEKESPLYTILQQQAEKEARLASGRAYSRAVANTGGFGSSYATLAAEEAGRQVMEGLDDQQLALYQAAREEFDAERQSALDWYNTAKQLHSDRMALEEMEKERLATEVPATITLEDGATVEVTDAAQELYADYLDSFTQGTGYDTLKTAMINGGASEADADQAIAMFKRLGSATISDQISALGTSPTLSGAAEIMAQAKAKGTEAEVLPEVSAAVSKSFTEALDNPSSAYGLLGVEPEKWDAMFAEYTDPDERAAAQKAYLLGAAGEARKSGLISGTDYTRFLRRDVVASVKDIIENETNKPVSAVAEVVISMQNYKDAGYITEAEYDRVIGTIAEMVDMEMMWKTQTAGKSTKDAKKFVKDAIKHLEYLGYTPSQSEERRIMEALDRTEDIMDLYENPGIKLVSNILEKFEDTTGIMTPEKWFSMTADQFAAIKEIQKKKKK